MLTERLFKKTIETLSTMYTVSVFHQAIPLKSEFKISRGTKKCANVLVVVIEDKEFYGWAESVPYARYDESISTAAEQIKALLSDNSFTSKMELPELISKLQPGAARNALDCACWDLQAKQAGRSVADILSKNCINSTCAHTLSIDTPQAMKKAVLEMNSPPLVKVKLDKQDIIARMTAIAHAAPHSKFIVDANEDWSFGDLENNVEALKALNVVLIEQPLPAGKDDILINFESPIPLCADESCHTENDLPYLQERYQVLNIKLDKTGGLTQACILASKAKEMGFDIMLGCMVGSSLAMAPASLLAAQASYVDLDGPLLVLKDRKHSFNYLHGVMTVLQDNLWGGAISNERFFVDSLRLQ